jgi:hypothetical protein
MKIRFIKQHGEIHVNKELHLPNGTAKLFIDGGYAIDVTNEGKSEQQPDDVDNVRDGKKASKSKGDK